MMPGVQEHTNLRYTLPHKAKSERFQESSQFASIASCSTLGCPNLVHLRYPLHEFFILALFI